MQAIVALALIAIFDAAIAGDFPEDFLGEEDHGHALAAALSMPEDAKSSFS